MMRLVFFCALTSSLAACGARPSASAVMAHQQQQTAAYPSFPDQTMTPGLLCDSPDSERYPEHIPYCERDVSTSLKQQIIVDYDRSLGYRISQMQRSQFKIDHYIPLCMGGSNQRGNLWPQHQTIYTRTDPIEQKLCELMARGMLSQVEAVAKIRYVKFHVDEAGAMDATLGRQLRR